MAGMVQETEIITAFNYIDSRSRSGEAVLIDAGTLEFEEQPLVIFASAEDVKQGMEMEKDLTTGKNVYTGFSDVDGSRESYGSWKGTEYQAPGKGVRDEFRSSIGLYRSDEEILRSTLELLS